MLYFYPDKKRTVALLFLALIGTLWLNHYTHYISEWGQWYSQNHVFYLQAQAFFNGRLLLGASPFGLGWDFIWANGVTHPWGLGVPFIRFLWDVIAHMLGAPIFPDRLTFLLAYFSCALYVLKSLFRCRENSTQEPLWLSSLGTFMIAGLLLLAPPFVALVKADVNVYEEVIAYGYLFNLLIFVGFLNALQIPSKGRMLALGVFAGFGPFIRPTLLFTGTMAIVMTVLFLRKSIKRSNLIVLVAPFIALLTILALLNRHRFGSPFEFGTRLNLENFVELTLLQKFPRPLPDFIAQIKDLGGALFFLKHFNGHNVWQYDLFPGQIRVIQWHEMYFTAYDPIYLFLFFASLPLFLVFRRTLTPSRSPLLLPALGWSLSSFLLMFIFYGWFRCMTSRYAIDFLAPIMVSIVVVLWVLSDVALQRNKGVVVGAFITALFLAWQIREIRTIHIHPHYLKKTNLTVAEVRHAMPTASWNRYLGDVRSYFVGMKNPTFGIPFNGAGWDPIDGSWRHSAIFFTSHTSSMTLTLQSGVATERLDPSLVEQVQAKVGLEYLHRRSLVMTDDQAVIVFDGPREKRYQTGLQVCFIGVVASNPNWGKVPLRIARLEF